MPNVKNQIDIYSNYEEDSIYLCETVYTDATQPYFGYLSITQQY